MRQIPIYAALLIFVATACVGGKKITLVDEQIIEFQTPYYQEIFPGQQDGQKLLILTLPIKVINYGYKVDSVYFHGYHEALMTNINGNAQEFRAKILIPSEKVEIIPPFPILETEALVSFTDDKGRRKMFKVENIVRKEPIFQP